jgi:hypothetical protein
MTRTRAKIEKNDKIKILEACDSKECLVCQEWKKKENIWKTFSFFPLHCYNCEFSGTGDDFEIIHRENIGTLICKQCYEKYLKRIKQVIKY